MRCYLLFAVLAWVAFNSRAHSQIDPFRAELAAARSELVAAKIEARHYWQVEYPRKRRELNAAVTFADAEVRALRRQLWEYGPFSRFSSGEPFSLTIENLRLCLLDAELRLQALRDERNNLIRFHADEGRLYDLRVAAARDRVVELEGGGVIEIEVVHD
jgi:hypothetical protein